MKNQKVYTSQVTTIKFPGGDDNGGSGGGTGGSGGSGGGDGGDGGGN